MIRLEHVTKTFYLGETSKTVARDITVDFPTGATIGLLGRNGAGKSTLMNMIAGNMDPSSGQITSDGTISYPVGFGGSFHRDLTGAQNTRFVARLYGIDTNELSDFVEDFAELGPHFHQPFHTYSAGMRSRLSFGVSMGIPFDFYLVDEVTSVGDAAFREKSQVLFLDRMKKSGAGSMPTCHAILRPIGLTRWMAARRVKSSLRHSQPMALLFTSGVSRPTPARPRG